MIQYLVREGEKILSKMPFWARLYSRPYQQTVQTEITLAQIDSEDVVLNIGCGAVPFTAIYLAELTGAKVWAVDKDGKAVEQARFYCEKIGLDKQIRFIEGDGSKSIPVNFTVAVVALQAEPKTLILDNLLGKANPGTRLIFRQPDKLFKSYYDCLPQDCAETISASQAGRAFTSVAFFIKQVKENKNAFSLGSCSL